ncbi:metalloregulator ArsR/SmtB family transcription factor [Streptomyces sp. NPDC046931]|uniref:ArsR/SmtB family transcription factor n=1 Tax=Streptomyces sp. NPDC046931 TaxID=3154806 RepID=UPI0033F72DD4
MSARMHLSPAHRTQQRTDRAADGHPRSPGEEQFALAAELLALLGDRTRLALLHALAEGEADVSTLTQACGAARPAVSQHLARLRLAGLVDTRKEGRRVIYALRDGHLRRVVDEALSLADHRLTNRPGHG